MKKVKIKFSVEAYCGLIFSSIGTLFVVIGALIYANIKDVENAILFPLIFCGVGGIFVVLGTAFLLTFVKKQKMIQAVIDGGYHVQAKITGVEIDRSENVNGQCPYYVNCSYQGNDGIVYVFRSENINYNPDTFLTSEYVTVYLDPQNYKKYYVDLDSVLPEMKFL